MNTKPGIPDHFTIHDVREHVARIFPDSATAAHHEADTDDETLKARAVRDIREAMHPAESAGAVLDAFAHKPIDIGASGRAAVQGIVSEIAAKVAPGHEPPTVVWTKPDDGRNGLPLGFFDDPPFVYEFTDANGPMRCHPASGVGPLTLHVKRPHVATLPDGRAVDLPAGTVLREGMTWEGPPADPLRDLCDAFKANPDPATAAMITKLREQVDRGASPLLAQALDLLRHARPWIADDAWSANEPPATMTRAQVAALRAEVDAFLAGMPIVSEGSQPEGSR